MPAKRHDQSPVAARRLLALEAGRCLLRSGFTQTGVCRLLGLGSDTVARLSRELRDDANSTATEKPAGPDGSQPPRAAGFPADGSSQIRPRAISRE